MLMNQEIMEWQWHQLDHMQIICTSLQPDNHACQHLITQFFTGWMLFLMPNQQHQIAKALNTLRTTHTVLD